ncbi:alcohol dehydrogenase catalytic domain-containing protein [Gordonia amarae]|uniref:Alcohol dehydrogenase n=2 Tax=Gordonia amarae TaxID=36821 RepID=G7GV51_9ACTN|nr:zinc-dependent alcohol dehydrogenase family protein [Gordonia amarae]MCS3876873.1 alcohol dehydrogenase [Gordonia amarae]QHN15707.1 alcohol dehydrogenase catalytic domain-containing protein [Gordonia amarae]QHN20276.1 alcohol dehydrogenase catalytic domain-containing protein [Gordonia amarae]QHN29127.1 alcohol dehydrogenase catalytic domain-containing protein [Gordonia amarae]QHN37907.1 alcohol dehydrogenase catalytic domain-containing protein [Gordonia amarae]
MKGLVYHGPGKKAWEEVPDPVIQKPTDVIVKITATTICGSDLHILKGDVPTVDDGRVLGHEGVGVITEVGSAVTNLVVGDRVLISCISSCGRCAYCRDGVYSHCLGEEGVSGLGWLLGHLINGTQAEYVRIPYAETSLYKLPDTISDAQAVPLSDILPTGNEIGVLNGRVGVGDVVAVIGAGPVGLAAIMTAQLHGPSKVIAVDLDAHRLDESRAFGATDIVQSGADDWKQQVLALTDGLGVDVSIEAVGIPATFQMALDIVRPGGTVANVGVHGESVTLHIEDLWISNVALTTGLVNTRTTPTLLKLVEQQRLAADKFVSHTFALSQIEEAYDVFGRAAETKALKVLLSAD